MRLPTDPRIVGVNGIDAVALKKIVSDICKQLNLASEGQIVGATNAYTAAPTSGTYQQGDFVRNSAPSGSTPTFGWVCTAAGTPGTWVAVSGGALGMSNPMTTAGDIIVGGAAGAPTRLAIGTSGFVLTVSGGTPAWAASSGGLTIGLANALAYTAFAP